MPWEHWKKVDLKHNRDTIELITHKSPQEPDAIFSPIFSNLLSISQSPDFALRQIAFSTDDWEQEGTDNEPYIIQIVLSIAIASCVTCKGYEAQEKACCDT